MTHNIGIMQGRLTEPRGRGIQFFPFDNWEKEFYVAKECGLQEIEFIFDYENYRQNPLWDPEGLNKVKDLMESTSVQINAVCFDYFMRRPFYKVLDNTQLEIKEENTRIIKTVLASMEKLGISLIEIPLVDDSSLKSEEEKIKFQEWLGQIIEEAPSNIKFGLETDLPVHEFKNYILSFGMKRIGANYDSGNSSGIGYDLYEEVTTLQDLIFNIHIKDRVLHGSTVELGTGNANFEMLFQGLKEISYAGSFILQAARGEEGKEQENVLSQIMFLTKFINRYGL